MDNMKNISDFISLEEYKALINKLYDMGELRLVPTSVNKQKTTMRCAHDDYVYKIWSRGIYLFPDGLDDKSIKENYNFIKTHNRYLFSYYALYCFAFGKEPFDIIDISIY